MRWLNTAVVLVFVVCRGPAVVAGQRIDAKAAAELLMAADRDFNQAVVDRDMNRFLSLVADTATFNGGTAREIHGRDEVGRAWAPFFQVDGPRLTWKPTKAEVLVGGEVG
jgi:ketosteroid isomerase-like protein